MNLELASNEQIVKDWQYATSSGRNGNFSHNLTVTNKRIVAHEQSKNSSRHNEIMIEHVRGTELRYRKQINRLGILLVFWGAIMLLYGLISIKNNSTMALWMIIGGASFLSIGIIMIIFFSKAQLIVIIFSDINPANGLSIYANSIPPILRASKRGKATTVKVNPQVANEIVSTLGSIILVK